MSNSRLRFSTKENPATDDQPKNTNKRTGAVALNVYKPGFIDTVSTEFVKMSVDRELGELSKALYQTEENNIKRGNGIIEYVKEWVVEGAGGEIAGIKEQIKVLVEDGKALAEKVVTLTASVEENSAKIQETNRVIAELDRVTAEKLSNMEATLTTETGRLSGLIQDESSIRLTADESIVRRINEMESTFEGEFTKTNASIKTEEELRTSADEALARRTSALEASLSGDLSNLFLNGYFESGQQHGFDGYGIVRDISYTQGPPNPPSPNRLEISVRENLGKRLAVAEDDIYYISLYCATDITSAPTLRLGFKNFDSNGNFINFVAVESRDASSTWKKIYGTYNVPTGTSYIQLCALLDYNATDKYWHITNVVWNNITEQGGVYAAIKREEIARVTADEALAKVTERMEAEYKAADRDITVGLDNAQREIVSAKAAIQKESETRANADEALARETTTLEAKYNKITGDLQNGLGDANAKIVEANAAIQRESEARANADSALARESSRIEAEYKSADGVLQNGINGANTSITEAKAAIKKESEARSSADEALAKESSRIEAAYKAADNVINGELGNVNKRLVSAQAAIDNEITVRSNQFGSLASTTERIESEYKISDERLRNSLNEVDSIAKEAKASIVSESETRANADEALAKRASKLEARMSEDLDNLFANGSFDPSMEHGLGTNGTIRAADYSAAPAGCPAKHMLEVRNRDQLSPNSISVIEGNMYYFSMYCATKSTTAPNIRIGMRMFKKDGTVIWAAAASRGRSSTWAKIDGTYTIPAGVVSVQFWIQLDYSGTTEPWFITGIQWQNNSSESVAYAAIKREEEARVTEDAAITKDYKEQVSILDGKYTSIKQYSETNIDKINGSLTTINSKWGVSVDANGRVAGIELNNGSKGSEFIVAADKFKFQDTSGNKSGGFTSSGGVTTFSGDLAANNGYFRGKIFAENLNGDISAKTRKKHNYPSVRLNKGWTQTISLGRLESAPYPRVLWAGTIDKLNTFGVDGASGGGIFFEILIGGVVVNSFWSRQRRTFDDGTNPTLTHCFRFYDRECPIPVGTYGDINLRMTFNILPAGADGNQFEDRPGTTVRSMAINFEMILEVLKTGTSLL